MANQKSDIYTLQTVAQGDNRADGRLLSGKVRQATATFTVAATGAAANDTVQLVKLPTGCLIDQTQSFVQAVNPGTALVVDIGTAAADDDLADGIILSSGGKVPFAVSTTDDLPLVEVAAGNELVTMLYKTVTSPTGSTDVRVVITYIDYN